MDDDAPELIELTEPVRTGSRRQRAPTARAFAGGALVGATVATWLFLTLGARNAGLTAAAAGSLTPAPSVAEHKDVASATPPPNPPPSATRPPSPSPSASIGPCVTATLVATTGGAMPPATVEPLTVPAGLLTAGAYVTAPGDGSRTPVDVWSLRSGAATRVASFAGNPYTFGLITDVSADGSLAVLQIGEEHITMPLPDCIDLYAIRLDGSGVTKLTMNGPDQQDTDARISPDGRWVASLHADLGATTSAFDLIDLRPGGGRRIEPCGDGLTPGPSFVAWAPNSRNVAVLCGSTLKIRTVASSDASATSDVPIDGEGAVGIGWRSASSVVVITAVGGTDANAPLRFRTVPVSASGAGLTVGSWSAAKTVRPRLADGIGRMQVAPDGHAALVLASSDGPDSDRWYVIDFRTARAEPVTGFAPDGDDGAGWSSDSRSIVWLDRWNRQRPTFIQTDLATGLRRTLGVQPPVSVDGVFRGR